MIRSPAVRVWWLAKGNASRKIDFLRHLRAVFFRVGGSVDDILGPVAVRVYDVHQEVQRVEHHVHLHGESGAGVGRDVGGVSTLNVSCSKHRAARK